MSNDPSAILSAAAARGAGGDAAGLAPAPAGGPVRVVALGASLRRQSLNRKLAATAAALAAEAGAAVEVLDLPELGVPLYDGDLEATAGLPAGVRRTIDAIRRADGVVLAAPEFNHSASGVAKNLVDWVSRGRPYPLQGKPVLLLSATPSPAGGRAGLAALRTPLEAIGAAVRAEGFGGVSAVGVDGLALSPEDADRLVDGVRSWLGQVAEARAGQPA